MPVAKLNTGFNIEVDFNIAAFHKRLLALLTDMGIIIAYVLVIGEMLKELFGSGLLREMGFVSVLFYLPVLLYGLVCEVYLNGQTFGKKLLGIQVITIEGGEPTISQFLLRWLFKSIDFPFWLLFAVTQGSWPWYLIFFVFSGLVCFLYTARSQRIGDLLAGTMVIDKKALTSWQDTAFMEVQQDYLPQFPQVMKMSDRDMNTIKQVLNTAISTRDYDYANRVCTKIKTALQIETDLDAFDFMEVLLKDYNFLSSR
jgi:uncharacterized RDD family membrane protein YckC